MKKYIYIRNAKSGGAKKYSQAIIEYAKKSQYDIVIESSDGLYTKDGLLLTSFSDLYIVRVFQRRLFLYGLRPDNILIPYQIIPIDIFLSTFSVRIMIRNMEPFHFSEHYTLRNRLRNLILKYWTLLSCIRAHDIVCVAQHTKQLLLSYYLGKLKIKVVPHGITGGDISRTVSDTTLLDRNGNRPYILSVGSGLPYRGLEDLISVASKKPEYNFIWAGEFLDIKYKKHINRLLRTKSCDNVFFVGHVTRSQVLDLMACSSLYLATSRVEACPNTALEAISIGCRIVATDIPAHKEFLKDRCLYYSSNESSNLVEVINKSLLLKPKKNCQHQLNTLEDSVIKFLE